MKIKTKKLVYASLMAVIVMVCTLIVRIPTPAKGYMNLGDAAVLLCGWTMGPLFGFLSAGLGSFLADLAAGYAVYAPVTFLIKGLMALVAFYIHKLLKNHSFSAKLLSAVAAEIIMVGGYFVFESILYGAPTAALSVISNVIQGTFGIVAGIIFMTVLEKRNLLK